MHALWVVAGVSREVHFKWAAVGLRSGVKMIVGQFQNTLMVCLVQELRMFL